MKNQKARGRHELKQERQFRKMVIVMLLVVVAICVGYWLMNQPAPTKTAKASEPFATSENQLEKYILAKLTTNDVSPGSTPVIIYRFSPESGDGSVAGSGTLFEGSNGLQLFTSAHIFSIENNGATNIYAIRKLRPLEGHSIDYGIEGFMPDDVNIPGYRDTGVDAVLCKVGPRPQPIASFYTKEREKAEEKRVIELVPLKEAKIIQSNLSGEYVPVVGWSAPSNGLTYLVILYDSRPGESGTLFVDKNGGRYILKGQNESLVITPEAEKQMGYPLHSSYATVIGSFRKQ